MLKQYQVNFDVGFKPNTLTGSLNPNPNGTIVYKVGKCVRCARRRCRPYLELSSEGKMMPTLLSMSDSITRISPAYLSLLKGANFEITLIL